MATRSIFIVVVVIAVGCGRPSIPEKINSPIAVAKPVVGHETASHNRTTWAVTHRWKPKNHPTATITLGIDKQELQQAIDNFGVERREIDVTYQDNLSLHEALNARESRFLARGIEQEVRGSEVVLRVAFARVVALAVPNLRPLRDVLVAKARAHQLSSDREIVEWFAAFVQSFGIDVPPSFRKNSMGHEVVTAGARTPLETFYLGAGDCDSLSLLFATLVSLQDMSLIMLAGSLGDENHVLVGVELPPRTGDLIVEHNERWYVVFDLTTTTWPTGLAPEIRNLIKSQHFEVIEFQEN